MVFEKPQRTEALQISKHTSFGRWILALGSGYLQYGRFRTFPGCHVGGRLLSDWWIPTVGHVVKQLDIGVQQYVKSLLFLFSDLFLFSAENFYSQLRRFSIF